MVDPKLKNYLDTITELRMNSRGEITKENVNTLIGIVIFGLIGVMILFGYVWPVKWLLMTGFVIGLILLCVLIVAKSVWFPAKPSGNDDGKDFKENSKKNKPKPSSFDGIGLDLDNLGLPSAEEYNKITEKAYV